MLNQYLQELEQDPFDPEEFVERLAWRVQTNSFPLHADTQGSTPFDAELLHSAFTDSIQDLKLFDSKIGKKCEKLELSVKEEEGAHWHRIAQLLDQNRESFRHFQSLSVGMNGVSTKVVHLGDQLASSNTPRARAVEAHRLMNHFAEFLSEGPLVSEVFTDKTRIYEAADVIQKLNLIAQELPAGKFEGARERIAAKYTDTEVSLLGAFVKAQLSDDVAGMRSAARTLEHFKDYAQCVNAFIGEVLIGSLRSRDMFSEIVPLCESSQNLIRQVFSDPEQVMTKFVIRIFQEQLKGHIESKLECKHPPEMYLRQLHDLYLRTTRLCEELKVLDLGSDTQMLNKLTKQIFQSHLSSYVSTETRYLKEKFALVLSRFYEGRGHTKKANPGAGGMNEIREKIQDALAAKGAFVGGVGATTALIDDRKEGSEALLLSEEVAVAMLQETKQALLRCHLLSSSQELPANAVEIFELLCKALLVDHVDYAVEVCLQALPSGGGEMRGSGADLAVFEAARQSSAIVNLLDKLFADTLVPMIISTPKHGECLQRKKHLTQALEEKLQQGIGRALGGICARVRAMLAQEQKRGDFKPEDGIIATKATPACDRVVRWLKPTIVHVKTALDGANLDGATLDLGLRLHRVLYDHVLKFEYSILGAMAVICDVNEYRKCAAELQQPLVATLFETLYTLCKLLQVSPENLPLVCSGDQLSELDRTVLANFIQLRSDYKTEKKLALHFK